MPKELFNGTVSSVEPDDSERIALGLPSVSGSKNLLWGVFKSFFVRGQVERGVTALLPAGNNVITFDNEFTDNSYILVINVIDASGVQVGWTLLSESNTGFSINISFEAKIKYIAIK